MKTKNGLHLFPGFLMPTANRKISENFKLIDPLLGGGAPKEENYIEYDGKKYSGFVFDIPGGGAPPEGNIGSELNFQSGITTTGAKNGFIVVSAVLQSPEDGLLYVWPIWQLSKKQVTNQFTLQIDPIEYHYLNADTLHVHSVNLYVMP